jgi:hypothetical protein
VLPVPEASTIADDDISSVVAYDGHVGVMWSNQRAGAMYWASRPSGADDGAAWTVTAAVQGPALADDHVNLKALHEDPAGLVIATIKTSRNDLPSADPDDPLILVLVLQRDGTWSRHVASTVSENETRPILEVDQEHRQLYLVASGPCCSGGTIYYKTTSLDEIDFPSGRGTVLMRRTGSTSALNNPSATKQAIDGTSGLLILAADDEAQVYMHAALPLTGPAVPKPSAPDVLPGGLPAPGADPAASKPILDDGFESDGTQKWTTVQFGPQSTVVVEPAAARTDRLGLRLSAADAPGAFAMARFAFPTTRSSLRVDLDFQVLEEGAAGGNTSLLRLLYADGSRLVSVYRQNAAGGRIWITDGTTRSSTLGRVELNTWAHLEIATARVGDVVQVNVLLDGQLIGGTTLAPAIAAMSMIQLGNETKGQSFGIAVDNVRLYR